MKLTKNRLFDNLLDLPAAFRRLCVETAKTVCASATVLLPAAFRRLCVETGCRPLAQASPKPAAFRRLCVETATAKQVLETAISSRLQAAVC